MHHSFSRPAGQTRKVRHALPPHEKRADTLALHPEAPMAAIRDLAERTWNGDASARASQQGRRDLAGDY